ncbi:EF-hand domain-containing protein [Jannaschia marina]|uniref:hypothetical protein n=1 Tax=Jannaschia marina TaxID=2741674 RepID=UPI0015C866A2|nr:hypothetical protein [Jannaschia marina]
MKSFITTAAITVALATPLMAQGALDADGDGNVSLEELQTAFPDMTAESFAAMDTDADGVLSATELQDAVDAGLLPS